jgi:hypothetical protein
MHRPATNLERRRIVIGHGTNHAPNRALGRDPAADATGVELSPTVLGRIFG